MNERLRAKEFQNSLPLLTGPGRTRKVGRCYRWERLGGKLLRHGKAGGMKLAAILGYVKNNNLPLSLSMSPLFLSRNLTYSLFLFDLPIHISISFSHIPQFLLLLLFPLSPHTLFAEIFAIYLKAPLKCLQAECSF